jgi:hypothetical protein
MSENQIVESSFTAIINASTAPSGVSDNSPAGSTTCLSRYALIADADQVHSAMYPGSIFGPLFTPLDQPPSRSRARRQPWCRLRYSLSHE